MNTTPRNAALSSSQATEEVTLGWNSMPTYGEVMTDLYGAQHIALEAYSSLPTPPAPTNLFMENFWSTVRNQLMVMAA